jgi:hypothetical protein
LLLCERLFQRVTLLVEVLDRNKQSGDDADECGEGGDRRGYDRSVHELSRDTARIRYPQVNTYLIPFEAPEGLLSAG